MIMRIGQWWRQRRRRRAVAALAKRYNLSKDGEHWLWVWVQRADMSLAKIQELRFHEWTATDEQLTVGMAAAKLRELMDPDTIELYDDDRE